MDTLNISNVEHINIRNIKYIKSGIFNKLYSLENTYEVIMSDGENANK